MTTKDLRDCDVTPREIFEDRRKFLTSSVKLAGLGGLLSMVTDLQAGNLPAVSNTSFKSEEPPTSLERITSYNNFYEFSTDKEQPKQLASTLVTSPWQVRVEGEVGKPQSFDLEDLIHLAPLEERIYRFRCVETWSMVVPWIGYPLSKLLDKVEPTSKAKFVVFETLADPRQMPGVNRAVLDWPYTEGLRIDEAMNPLTLLTLGLYGDLLPKQNGAPVRLIVPWKYGFKSAKSIVRIRLQESMPHTSWMKAGPNEYGFYANVNPEVDHPRWSQAKERRLGELFKRSTLPFNGYAEQVGMMYSQLDLSRNF